MVRFFANEQDISTDTIKLSEEDSKHIRTLRLRPDEQFIICDGNKTDYICKLGERGDCSIAEILNKQESHGEPSVKCRVFMAYSKGDRLDYAVQKSVELGANEIILFESDRCVAVPRDVAKKAERLQRISHETAKQSGRGIIPAVTSGGNFSEIINEAVQSSDLVLLFYENEDDLHIKEFLEKHLMHLSEHEQNEAKSISIITGPEGGFETNEVKLAGSKNIPAVSLGPRILRSETAPVAALTAIMYQTGNL